MSGRTSTASCSAPSYVLRVYAGTADANGHACGDAQQCHALSFTFHSISCRRAQVRDSRPPRAHARPRRSRAAAAGPQSAAKPCTKRGQKLSTMAEAYYGDAYQQYAQQPPAYYPQTAPEYAAAPAHVPEPAEAVAPVSDAAALAAARAEIVALKAEIASLKAAAAATSASPALVPPPQFYPPPASPYGYP
eukprot:4981751-Prymnesium_polylepis.1